MTTISISDLEQLCIDALQKAGLRAEDAQIATDHYLENECSGKASHGMVRVVEATKIYQKFKGGQHNPTIETDTGNMVVMNAQRALGAVSGHHATHMAIERANEHGLAFVGIHNHIGNSGAMAYYLRRIADAGLIAIMGTNSVAMVAPPGGKERRIGTNPVGIAIPGENDTHMIADFGTSAMVYGKMLVCKDKGEPIPEGALIDKDGNPSTNFDDAYDGAMLPLADYRGFALGLMVELLAGTLINGKSVKQDLYDEDGLFIIALDPKKLGHLDFYSNIFNDLKKITDTPPRPGHDPVTLPGQRSFAALKKAQASGTVDVVDQTLEKLKNFVNEENI